MKMAPRHRDRGVQRGEMRGTCLAYCYRLVPHLKSLASHLIFGFRCGAKSRLDRCLSFHPSASPCLGVTAAVAVAISIWVNCSRLSVLLPPFSSRSPEPQRKILHLHISQECLSIHLQHLPFQPF